MFPGLGWRSVLTWHLVYESHVGATRRCKPDAGPQFSKEFCLVRIYLKFVDGSSKATRRPGRHRLRARGRDGTVGACALPSMRYLASCSAACVVVPTSTLDVIAIARDESQPHPAPAVRHPTNAEQWGRRTRGFVWCYGLDRLAAFDSLLAPHCILSFIL